jgi:uncharacterized membrane protein
MSNPVVSGGTANIGKVLIVAGLIFVVWKVVRKHSNKKPYETIKRSKKQTWYNIHKAAFALATILGFVHFVAVEVDPKYLLSGWILGISMVIMFGQGIYLGFRSGWQPFTGAQDQQYKTMRIVKWILTPIMFLSMVWHFFPTAI